MLYFLQWAVYGYAFTVVIPTIVNCSWNVWNLFRKFFNAITSYFWLHFSINNPLFNQSLLTILKNYLFLLEESQRNPKQLNNNACFERENTGTCMYVEESDKNQRNYCLCYYILTITVHPLWRLVFIINMYFTFAS